MGTKLTAQDLLLAHIQVCDSLGKDVKVNQPRVLTDIENQVSNNFDWFVPVEVAAYVGIQIVRRKPFENSNDATAVALTLALMNAKRSIEPSEAIDILKASSIVDEVADQLMLAGR